MSIKGALAVLGGWCETPPTAGDEARPSPPAIAGAKRRDPGAPCGLLAVRRVRIVGPRSAPVRIWPCLVALATGLFHTSLLAAIASGCEEPAPTAEPRGVGRGVSGETATADAAPAEVRSVTPRREEERGRPAAPPSAARTAAVAPADAGASVPSRADELVRSVEASAAPVVACLSQHGGGGAQASVAVEFEVSGTGRVTRAEVAAPARSPLESCVRRAAEAVRFPEGEATHFRYEYRVRR